jgi:hypothetical protein
MRSRALSTLTFAALLPAIASAQCQETWIATQTYGGFATANGQSVALFDPDGAGPQQPWIVVAGGSSIPGVASDRIAAWDGTQWRALGAGFNGAVRALHVHNGALYAGGDFFISGGIQYIARWDGTNWQPLGTPAQNGTSTAVYSMTSFGGNLVVGGYFQFVNGNTVPTSARVASWNGSTWSAIGSGGNNGVEALTVFNGELYAGGVFTQMSGTPNINRIARWTGSAWVGMGDGLNSSVSTLHVHNNQLHAGGNFTQSGLLSVPYVGRWTGTAWESVGAGFNTTVNALGTYNGNLIAGGSFTQSGGQSVTRIAQFISGAWSTLGSGVNNAVTNFIVTPANELVLVGSFTTAGALETTGLARYNGLDYVSFGNYLSNGVNDLKLFNNDLYAAGKFRFNGSSSLGRVARFSSGQWQPIGGAPFNRDVNVLQVFNGQLWAGGEFFVGDGGSTANHAAFYNGTTWTPANANNAISAFAVYNGVLHAGGNLTGNLATWSGTAWVPFSTATRPSAAVTNLLVWNNQLVVAGNFQNVGSPAIPNTAFIAAWNGTSWNSFGTNAGNTSGNGISALGIHNNQLHAGGSFTSIGGTTANRIARWNGSTWEAIGGGAQSQVEAIASYNSELVISGSFNQVDGSVGAAGIARWNGAQWRPLGSGLAGTTFSTVNGFALLPHPDGTLRVGGQFTTAGGLPSSAYGIWTGGGGAISITQQPQSDTVCPSEDILLTVGTTGSGTFTYQWRKDGFPLRDGRGILGANTPNLSIDNAAALDAGTYDVVVFNNCGPLLSSAATITIDSNCGPVCATIDFNGDGSFFDPCDIDAFLTAFSEGGCTSCGL